MSRTLGTDHVVDELYLTFTHTQEIPWMLPGVPPTDKYVEIALVSVVGIRAGKLQHEHIYWDQASVLVQIGLLDPFYIPPSFTPAGPKDMLQIKRLPVLGAESAWKLADPELGESNRLFFNW